ncbi:RIO-like serine/threonine kinase [Desulfurococcus amylolyticus 1221n]|uniref:non-specific serine/threonine protein kinase n=1 Tax=Desulfurococcus amylolyticus (strain DSM 18924 / JCM 16383 / VKM B-2413 / 1221n) TaxID=490899 RepID=B8D380_DESA1|nr:RIO1 family regulatory kinase/ATPase [Desulfurococcus amylolyticus]ACL10351.1 RIO-like serine/threonine kinase [Desulfurococcus amylolyticus 1221n]
MLPGEIYKSLTDKDFKVLAAIEKGISRGMEYVALETIERISGLHEGEVILVLGKLHELGLVRRKTIAGYKAYRLTYIGYDMLAFRALVNKNILEALGNKIGVGKESEIYIGLAPGGLKVVVKVLRIGRTSFQRTRLLRSWSSNKVSTTWYEESKLAAEREFKALKTLSSINALVPVPLGYNRHVIVTEYIEGVELYKRPELRKPEQVLEYIIDTISKAYREAGIVHGDLSEYNIIVTVSDEKPYVIDWPQYIYREEPNALQLLRRDVEYVVKFFNKVYGLNIDHMAIYNRIVSAG